MQSRVALVTGGTGGIGSSIVQRLAAMGHRVATNYRDEGRALAWQSKMREGALRERLLTDEHSPAKYRVNGAVRNMDASYKAFNVQPGDKLYLAPDQRVHVW